MQSPNTRTHVKPGNLHAQGKAALALQRPRGAHSEQCAHDQAQVSGCRLNKPAFLDIHDSPEPRASGTSGLAHMCEGSLSPRKLRSDKLSAKQAV